MEPSTIMLVIGVASALIFGPRTAQSTERREKTYGGGAAQLLNLIACMAFVSLPLTILSGLDDSWSRKPAWPLAATMNVLAS